MRNIVVGQSGGPTAAINSSLAGVFYMARELGADKIYGMLNGIDGFVNGRYIDMKEYITTDVDVELLRRTPSAYLGSCRFKLPEIEGNEDLYNKIFDRIKELDIEIFVYIGGNDSMDTIYKLSEYAKRINYTDTKFMGAPKTIDNDLAVTDHTPGFGSAAKYIATSVKELMRDATCLKYPDGIITVVEIMGRDAGWLTGAAALAKCEDCEGPALIYLPEVDFDLDDFEKRVTKLIKEKQNVVVAISEGIRCADGKYVCELGESSSYVDAFGHKQLTGTATFLANYIAGKVGCKSRAIEFSILQRCASHIASKTDLDEAFATGKEAIRRASMGETAKMVYIKRLSTDPYNYTIETEDISKIANAVKSVPREWINESGTYVTDEFISYIRPLIEGEMSQIMSNGIPAHIKRPY